MTMTCNSFDNRVFERKKWGSWLITTSVYFVWWWWWTWSLDMLHACYIVPRNTCMAWSPLWRAPVSLSLNPKMHLCKNDLNILKLKNLCMQLNCERAKCQERRKCFAFMVFSSCWENRLSKDSLVLQYNALLHTDGSRGFASPVVIIDMVICSLNHKTVTSLEL